MAKRWLKLYFQLCYRRRRQNMNDAQQIHVTAIVSSSAVLGKGVEIGPYCIVHDKVVLEDNVKLLSHVCVGGNTYIGDDTVIYPFATIGYETPDLKYKGENSRLIIGKNNRIREYVTIHPGTEAGGMETVVGDNCIIMNGAHIAHDCI